MCDYTSAGNTWQEGNIFRVWAQQPFDFRHLYTNNVDWRVNVTVGVGVPRFRTFIRNNIFTLWFEAPARVVQALRT